MSTSPCAACQHLRQKCVPECVFAPFFPPQEKERFICVHRVYGAKNVAKILKNITPCKRSFAVESLCYEAQLQLQDPVNGCNGMMTTLQHRLEEIQQKIATVKAEINAAIGAGNSSSPLNIAADNLRPFTEAVGYNGDCSTALNLASTCRLK